MRSLLPILLLLALPLAAQDQGRVVAAPGAVLPLRARVDAVNRMLKDRLANVLPALMRESGIDLWLVINREYAEDPVYLTLVPAPEFAARRLSILVFHDRGDRVERLTVSRYGMDGFYEGAWDGKGGVDAQWRRLAEILRERNPKQFAPGRSGNEVFARARAAMEKEGIAGAIYSHPIGFFGHAPGTAIGMWDNQGPIAVTGDWTLRANTAYAFEGNVKVAVPEWNGQLVQVKLEQSAVFDGKRVVYLAGRQTEWHLVR